MIHLHDAIRALNSSIVTINNETALDIDGNVINYNMDLAQAKLVELQAAEEAAKQTQIDAKQTALNKLMALGLTEEEALALGK